MEGIWPTLAEPGKLFLDAEAGGIPPVPCSHLMHRKQGNNPDEYCDEDSLSGTDRCGLHTDVDHPEAHEL